jgi:hypothetical protein
MQNVLYYSEFVRYSSKREFLLPINTDLRKDSAEHIFYKHY